MYINNQNLFREANNLIRIIGETMWAPSILITLLMIIAIVRYGKNVFEEDK